MTFGSSKAALGTVVGNQFVVATEIYYERREGGGERGVKKKRRKKKKHFTCSNFEISHYDVLTLALVTNISIVSCSISYL